MFGKLPSSCRYHGNKCSPVEKLKKINIAQTIHLLLYYSNIVYCKLNIFITHTCLLYMT